jgi:glycosyltransferase involved in cell wall biosynthesis
MSSNPLVTIVLLTYKRPKLLKRAIQSALNQTYPHFKICIHDDASGDETEEVVAEMAKNDSRIFYNCNPQNLGVIRNSIQSWKHVDTPYFIELCDDNILLPNYLESTLNGFKKYPEALFSVNRIIGINKDRQIRGVSLPKSLREGLYEPPQGILFLIKEEPSVFAGTMFRSDVREKVGCYDKDIGLIADWDYIFRIAVQYPYVINDNPGVIFWVDEGGAAVSTRSAFVWPKLFKMYEKVMAHPNLDLDTKNELDFHFRARLKRMVVGQGKEAVRAGEYSAAAMSAQVLKDFFNSPRHCLKLKSIAIFSKWFPPYRWYYNLFNKWRSKKKLSEFEDRFSEYQKYASYLNDYDE